LPKPGDDEQLQELVGRLVSTMIDRNKPLWEIHFIEGLSENRTALFFKVHHCMVDGLAAIDIFSLLFDLTPEASASPKKPFYNPPPTPSQPQQIVDGVMGIIPNRLKVLRKLGGNLGEVAFTLLDKERRRNMFVGLSYLLNDNLSLLRPLPINGKNSGRQMLAWAEFSLSEVRAIKSARKTSVNDVVLSVLLSAIDEYIQRRGGGKNQSFIRALVPVSMRQEEEKEDYGNRISVIPVDMPLGLSDPLARLDAVSKYASVMKDAGLSNMLDIVLSMPSLAVSYSQPLVWKAAPLAFSVLAHLWSTNVAGPQIPLYIMGHQMQHTFGFFPLNPSMGLCCVTTSYNQRISMTLVADQSIIPDVNELRELLYKNYAALRVAAGVGEVAPIMIEKPKYQPESMPETAPVSAAGPQGNGSSQDPTEEGASENQNGSAPTEQPAGKPRMFSAGWANAYLEAINGSQAYFNASKRWDAGSLAFVMMASPENGYAQNAAVLLDLYHGKCREAKAMPVSEAINAASFVIEGDYAAWVEVLSGRTAPIAMIMRGRLKLRKGSMARLIPYTQSAQELLNCAQKIS
jgi:diacylglycerol O-acyltransferase / wax synthase